MQKYLLKIKDLKITLEDKLILEGVSFTVKRGEFVVILGPNGAGKSTLLRAILNKVPYQGTIEISPDTKIAYLPQRFFQDVYMPLLVKEYFALLELSAMEAVEILRKLGEKNPREFLKKPVKHLSGGESQKLFITTALMQKANLFILDEPLAFVDIIGQQNFFELLERWKKEKNIGVLMVSHEINIVTRFADKVVCLNREMLCLGEPLKVLTPKTIQKLYQNKPGLYLHEHE